MKRCIIALLTGLLASSSAEARIGDTKDECKARYQEPGKPNRFDNLFGKGGVDTDCTFDADGRCVRVSYRVLYVGSVDDSSMDAGYKFTADQTKKLLEMNAGVSKWEKREVIGGADHEGIFVTKDASRKARVNSFGVSVELTSYVEKQKAKAMPEAVDKTIASFGEVAKTMTAHELKLAELQREREELKKAAVKQELEWRRLVNEAKATGRKMRPRIAGRPELERLTDDELLAVAKELGVEPSETGAD